MCRTGADILSIDSPVDIGDAMEVIDKRATLMGNVDTSLMINGSTDDIKAASELCINQAGKVGGFILSTSCDMPIEVPEENIVQLVRSVSD
jgi:uroporphyrinogen-III decarboxylase